MNSSLLLQFCELGNGHLPSGVKTFKIFEDLQEPRLDFRNLFSVYRVAPASAVVELVLWNNPADQIGGMPRKESGGPLNNL